MNKTDRFNAVALTWSIACITIIAVMAQDTKPAKVNAAITAVEYPEYAVRYPGEIDTVRDAVVRNGGSKDDLAIVLAIRFAENGRPGLEFGIMNEAADDLDSQAGWCAATVIKNRKRWKNAGCKGKFIEFLGARYCPIGADNDPNGLNRHWVDDVKYYYNKLKG